MSDAYYMSIKGIVFVDAETVRKQELELRAYRRLEEAVIAHMPYCNDFKADFNEIIAQLQKARLGSEVQGNAVIDY